MQYPPSYFTPLPPSPNPKEGGEGRGGRERSRILMSEASCVHAMSKCHHLSSILDLSYTWCSTSSFKCSRHMQSRHTGDTGDVCHRGDSSSVGYHGGGRARHYPSARCTLRRRCIWHRHQCLHRPAVAVANAVVSLPAVDLCGSVTDGIPSPAAVFIGLAASTISISSTAAGHSTADRHPADKVRYQSAGMVAGRGTSQRPLVPVRRRRRIVWTTRHQYPRALACAHLVAVLHVPRGTSDAPLYCLVSSFWRQVWVGS